MRMDRTRGRSAADVLTTISEEELARALREFGDEPEAERVAALLVEAARKGNLRRTVDVSRLLIEAANGGKQGWRLASRRRASGTCIPPRARSRRCAFWSIASLAICEHLLRVLPGVLRPGGRAAIISFHSGEDRLVKSAFRQGMLTGVYAASVRRADPAGVCGARRQSAFAFGKTPLGAAVGVISASAFGMTPTEDCGSGLTSAWRRLFGCPRCQGASRGARVV